MRINYYFLIIVLPILTLSISLDYLHKPSENKILPIRNVAIQTKTEIDPAEYFKKHCGFCHNKEGLMASNMNIIKELYKKKYPKKEDFVNNMLNFVKDPSEEKALYKEGIKKYALMPKMPFKEEDLKAVISYIYDTPNL